MTFSFNLRFLYGKSFKSLYFFTIIAVFTWLKKLSKSSHEWKQFGLVGKDFWSLRIGFTLGNSIIKGKPLQPKEFKALKLHRGGFTIFFIGFWVS